MREEGSFDHNKSIPCLSLWKMEQKGDQCEVEAIKLLVCIVLNLVALNIVARFT